MSRKSTYIIKLYNNTYKIIHPVLVPLLDLQYIKLELDRRFAKLPRYTKYLPYLIVRLPQKKQSNVHQGAFKKPSVSRTELL